MICKHHDINGGGITCALLASVGIPRTAGPGNPNYPCDRCRSEWTNGTPPDPDDRTTWTPTLLSYLPPPPPNTSPQGLGDVVAATLNDWGVGKRKGCGCGKRQAFLNRLVPNV